MPTPEQIDMLIKGKGRRLSTRTGKRQYFVCLPAKIIKELICPKCLKILREHVGGNYIYIPTKSLEFMDKTEQAEQMIKDGKSAEDIKEGLNLSQWRFNSLMNSIMKRNTNYETKD